MAQNTANKKGCSDSKIGRSIEMKDAYLISYLNWLIVATREHQMRSE